MEEELKDRINRIEGLLDNHVMSRLGGLDSKLSYIEGRQSILTKLAIANLTMILGAIAAGLVTYLLG